MSLSKEIFNKNIRRNDKYRPVVDLLVYGLLNEKKKSDIKIFSDIKDLIIFAAMVGKKYERKQDVDKKENTGIIMGTFAGSGSGKRSRVDQHNIIFMFGLIVFQDMNYMRDENVDEVIAVFEKYSNGGLEVIEEWLIESGWNSLCLLEKVIDEIKTENDSGM
ncbi:MAG: hypothetical protein JMN27_18355 [gamma proteobacterium endosymbiont of Lamellibrachia anaximandri]|nr:hypothetical protein [gamma proteobacterium endosymbiont of Lamellibrachia anaximandri]MBL3535768.1 hypothetical protein [gamma proteobacterium endosymbiont of Lamellibrachia anaximandri]